MSASTAAAAAAGGVNASSTQNLVSLVKDKAGHRPLLSFEHGLEHAIFPSRIENLRQDFQSPYLQYGEFAQIGDKKQRVLPASNDVYDMSPSEWRNNAFMNFGNEVIIGLEVEGNRTVVTGVLYAFQPNNSSDAVQLVLQVSPRNDKFELGSQLVNYRIKQIDQVHILFFPQEVVALCSSSGNVDEISDVNSCVKFLFASRIYLNSLVKEAKEFINFNNNNNNNNNDSSNSNNNNIDLNAFMQQQQQQSQMMLQMMQMMQQQMMHAAASTSQALPQQSANDSNSLVPASMVSSLVRNHQHPNMLKLQQAMNGISLDDEQAAEAGLMPSSVLEHNVTTWAPVFKFGLVSEMLRRFERKIDNFINSISGSASKSNNNNNFKNSKTIYLNIALTGLQEALKSLNSQAQAAYGSQNPQLHPAIISTQTAVNNLLAQITTASISSVMKHVEGNDPTNFIASAVLKAEGEQQKKSNNNNSNNKAANNKKNWKNNNSNNNSSKGGSPSLNSGGGASNNNNNRQH